MIEVLSFNKTAEGLLYKGSQIRYVWSIKVNDIRHIVEFIEGSFGKKQLLLDQKELYSDRSVLSSNFNYKFLIDNEILILRKEQEEYDIFFEEDESKSFKSMLEQGKQRKVEQPRVEHRSALPGIQYSGDNGFNYSQNQTNTTQRQNAFLAFDFNKANTETSGEQFSSPDFNFTSNSTQNKPKHSTNPFADENDDYSFKNPEPRRMSQSKELDMFDSCKQENKPVETNSFFEDMNESNKQDRLMSEPIQGFVVNTKELTNNSNTIDPSTFDADLERSKKVNTGYIKSPFDLDAEETAEKIGDGLKTVFKKIRKAYDTIE